MRRVLVPFAVALVAAIAWLLLEGTRTVPPPTSEVARAADSSARSVARIELDGERSIATATHTPAAEAPPDSSEASVDAGSTKNDPSAIRLSGELVCIDVDGAHFAPGSAHFVLGEWNGSTGHTQRIEVENGGWQTSVHPCEGLAIEEIVADGRRLVVDQPAADRFAIPTEGFLSIRARRPVSSVLIVRGADHHRDLDGVDIQEGSRILLHGARSPITLDRVEDISFPDAYVHVGASGYVSRTVDLDLAIGGERLIELEPAGSVAVRVSGVPPGRVVALRVGTGDSSKPVANTAIRADGEHVIEAVPIGTWIVSAALGEWWDEPIVLASESVEVFRGGRSTVALNVGGVPEVRRAPLAGTLRVPRAWGFERFQLQLRRDEASATGEDQSWPTLNLYELERSKADDEFYAWSFGEVETGRYMVTFAQLELDTFVQLGPEGRTDLHIEIAPPCEVTIRVVAEETGNETQFEDLAWYCERPPESTGGTLAAVRRDPATHALVLRGPRQVVHFQGWDDRYERLDERVDLSTCPDIVVLRVKRPIAASIVLRDGDVVTPLPDEARVSAEAIEGDGRLTAWKQPSSGLLLQFDRSGRYRLHLPDVPGFEPVPPQEINVARGTPTEVVIALVRKR